MHYLLIYEVVPDYAERRVAHRAEHLALAWRFHDEGHLVLGGALAEPIDGAVLLFEGDSPEMVEDFVKADPYVRNGLVTRWQIRIWQTVVGKTAAAPVR